MDLGNLKTFTTIWSKVFAPQRALVSVLSSPLANRTLPPLCTSYWPRELKICLLVGQSSLKQPPQIDDLAQYYSDRIFTLRAKTVEKSTREKKRNFQSVDVDSMDASNVRSLGPEYVGHLENRIFINPRTGLNPICLYPFWPIT